jgi:hypothetical protein
MRAYELLTEASNKLKYGSTRGNVGEFILGAAITAKFLAGASSASIGDVHQVIRDTVAENLTKSFTRPDGEVSDKITFRNVIANQKNIQDINDVESLTQSMANEISAALKFANSDQYATKLSRMFATNGRPDEILVEAIGEEDQSNNKADIILKYIKPNGETKKLRPISLKIGSNLVGQGSPRTFENMKVFFADLGISIPEMPEYEQNVNAGVQKVLQYVADDLTNLTSGDDTTKEATLIQKISNFLNKHAALNDPKLIIVNLNKADYSVQKIKKMISNLETVNLETTYVKTGRPAVVVHNAGKLKDLLFKVRYTYSPRRIGSDGKERPERHRMFVEVGPLFKSLATISNDDPL